MPVSGQFSQSFCHTDLPSHLTFCLHLIFLRNKISLISCTDLWATSQKRAIQWLGQSFCWCSSLMSCFEGKTLLRSSWASVTLRLHRSFSDLFNFYKPRGITTDKPQFILQRSENTHWYSTRTEERQRCWFCDIIRNLTSVIVGLCKRGEVSRAS